MLAVSVLGLSTLFAITRAITLTVGIGIDETNGQLAQGFDPSTMLPAVGDTVAFSFQLPDYLKNPQSVQHSVTQSTFNNPCTPKPSGFDTGIQTAGSNLTFNLLINDTKPLWFYSRANNDCKAGMVLSMHPDATGAQTAAAFKAKAQASKASSTASGSAATSSAPQPVKSSSAVRGKLTACLALVFAVIARGLLTA